MSTSMPVRARRAKFVPPAPSPWLVSRPRLTSRLGDARFFPVTLLSAAAGSGKTTLLAEWVRTLDLPWGWLTVDESDTSLDLFLTNVITAMQGASPGIGESALSLLRIETELSLDAIVAELDDDLLALEHDLVVVLDDVHTIRDPRSVEFFQRLLQHPPPRLHLVLGARRDPLFPLARLRSHGQLLEIRGADLAFTNDESRELLGNAGVSGDPVQSLDQHNEGWAVGIHLGALALRKQPADARSVDDIVSAGVHNLIVDDILAFQSEPVQRLLLVSALVDRFTSDLCAVMLGDAALREPEVRSLLHEIAAEGLLLSSLGGEPEWFRFHQIFRDALHRELKQRLSPEELRDIHARASLWFEQMGMITESIDHALLAERDDVAASIIERHAQLAIASDQWPELAHWLERLPDTVGRSHAELTLAQAWVAQSRGNQAELRSSIDRARLLLEIEAPLHDAHWRSAREADVAILHLAMVRLQDDLEHALALGESVAANPSDRFVSGFGLYHLGLALIHLGDHERLEQVMGQIVAENQGKDDPFSRQRELWARLMIGVQHFAITGDLARSAQLAEELQGLATDYGLRRFVGITRHWLGWIAYERNLLDEAITQFEGAVHERSTGIIVLFSSMFALVRSLDAAGRSPEAGNVLARLTARSAPEGYAPFAKAAVQAFTAQRALRQGDLEAASRWLQSVQVWSPAPDVTTMEHPMLTRIRILLATNRLQEADRLLVEAEAAAAGPPAVVYQQFRVLALRALHAFVSGERERAVTDLRAACAMAARGGHNRSLLDLGLGVPAFFELLQLLPPAERPLPPDRLRRYYEVDSGEEPPARAAHRAEVSPEAMPYEQLTDRERDVVDGLMRRLSYKELAYELNISPLTVKSHTTRIYGKFGVSSRRQMIRLLEGQSDVALGVRL